MNHLRANTSGIDCRINEIQEDVYSSLVGQFLNIDGFGRVYRNKTDGGVLPEVFTEGNDYQEIYLDDTKDVSFCFINDEEHKTNDGTMYLSDVKVVFWYNLKAISDTDRADAEAQRLSVLAIKEAISANDIQGITTGIGNVFVGFKTDNIKFCDMHPFHCFSVNINIQYLLTQKCS